MKNIEIEIRIILEDDKIINEWLKTKAVKRGYKFQHDIYFEPIDKPFVIIDKNGFKDADEWLRIRIDKETGELCYKKWHRDKITNASLFADEIEIKIDNIENTLILLKYLGYRQISEIKKHRESWAFDYFLIEKDYIENLGTFYELEFKGEIDNPKEGNNIIINFLKNIGINDWKIIDRGYPWMQWNENWKNSLK